MITVAAECECKTFWAAGNNAKAARLFRKNRRPEIAAAFEGDRGCLQRIFMFTWFVIST